MHEVACRGRFVSGGYFVHVDLLNESSIEGAVSKAVDFLGECMTTCMSHLRHG